MIRKTIEYQCDLCKENFKEGEVRSVNNFIIINNYFEFGEDDSYIGIELIRLSDIRKAYLQLPDENCVKIQYYNHSLREVRTLCEMFKNREEASFRLHDLLRLLNSSI